MNISVCIFIIFYKKSSDNKLPISFLELHVSFLKSISFNHHSERHLITTRVWEKQLKEKLQVFLGITYIPHLLTPAITTFSCQIKLMNLLTEYPVMTRLKVDLLHCQFRIIRLVFVFVLTLLELRILHCIHDNDRVPVPDFWDTSYNINSRNIPFFFSKLFIAIFQ